MMEFVEIGLIVVTVMLFVLGAISKRKLFIRWGGRKPPSTSRVVYSVVCERISEWIC